MAVARTRGGGRGCGRLRSPSRGDYLEVAVARDVTAQILRTCARETLVALSAGASASTTVSSEWAVVGGRDART